MSEPINTQPDKEVLLFYTNVLELNTYTYDLAHAAMLTVDGIDENKADELIRAIEEAGLVVRERVR